MARTIDTIFNSMLEEKARHEELDALDSTSRTAIYRLILYIGAVCAWALENLWDIFRTETDTKISQQTLGKATWYQQMALAFQYGYALPTNSDKYDNSALTEAEVAASKIVQYAAVTDIDGKLQIKAAKKVDNSPSPLSAPEKAAFTDYMERIRFAGVKIIVKSQEADALKMALAVWYNPLVIRADGSYIDGSGATPVKDAINAYLNQLPFNGEFSEMSLIDFLQQVRGVMKVKILLAQAKYGLNAFEAINEHYIPDAGYLQVADADLTITNYEYVQY